MRLRRRAVALAAALIVCAGTAVLPAASASANPSQEFCLQAYTLCLNRAGGGQGVGTHIIGYVEHDNNNDFTNLNLGSWCGGTGIVRNGEGGILCPFRNGSGLNARYDGAKIIALWSYNLGLYGTIPSFSNGNVALGNYGDQGYAWVMNSAGYVVSVGESNWLFDNGHGSNNPAWLWFNEPYPQYQARAISGISPDNWHIVNG